MSQPFNLISQVTVELLPFGRPQTKLCCSLRPCSLIQHRRASQALAQLTIPDFSPATPHTVQPLRTPRWAPRVSLPQPHHTPTPYLWLRFSLIILILPTMNSLLDLRLQPKFPLCVVLSSLSSKVTLPSLVFSSGSFSPSTEATDSSRE